jgi:hypothetical protein
MLRKELRSTGILVSIVIVALDAGIGYFALRKPEQVPASSIKVAMTPERIVRGKYIFETLADCDGCHSERDFTRVGGPVVLSGRGKGNVLSSLIRGLPGTVVASNITPDPETGIGRWTDGEKIRAIRDGVDREGRALFPMMPYVGFRKMSDEDVESLVAYLDQLPPVKNPLPQTELQFPVGLMIKSVPQPRDRCRRRIARTSFNMASTWSLSGPAATATRRRRKGSPYRRSLSPDLGTSVSSSREPGSPGHRPGPRRCARIRTGETWGTRNAPDRRRTPSTPRFRTRRGARACGRSSTPSNHRPGSLTSSRLA